jgi:hypothetical protein
LRHCDAWRAAVSDGNVLPAQIKVDADSQSALLWIYVLLTI